MCIILASLKKNILNPVLSPKLFVEILYVLIITAIEIIVTYYATSLYIPVPSL